jgi:hypothetical protein
MSIFLKVISGLYLVLVWFAFASTFVGVHVGPSSLDDDTVHILGFFIALVLSIPAAALFGFAQIIGDVREMRNTLWLQADHLAAMRRYYEPHR